MAEEEQNNAEETPEAEAPEETPAPEESPPAEEAAPEEAPPAEETPTEEPPAEAEEPPAEEEAPAEEEPAAEAEPPAEDEEPVADAEEPPADAAPAGDEEPAETLTPKQLRKRERSIHTGEAKPERGPEERATERASDRAAKSASRRRVRASQRGKRGEPGQGTPPAERAAGTKKVQLGTVVSDKADKTITVRVDIVRRHRKYQKVVRQSATVRAHDERNEAAEGDVVRVIESRPLSRTKRWRLVEVVEKAPVRT
jgi:small subunit ribosomal protein S17